MRRQHRKKEINCFRRAKIKRKFQKINYIKKKLFEERNRQGYIYKNKLNSDTINVQANKNQLIILNNEKH